MYELEARLVIHAHFRNKLFIFLSDPILNNVQLCWPSWIYDPQKRAMPRAHHNMTVASQLSLPPTSVFLLQKSSLGQIWQVKLLQKAYRGGIIKIIFKIKLKNVAPFISWQWSELQSICCKTPDRNYCVECTRKKHIQIRLNIKVKILGIGALRLPLSLFTSETTVARA